MLGLALLLHVHTLRRDARVVRHDLHAVLRGLAHDVRELGVHLLGNVVLARELKPKFTVGNTESSLFTLMSYTSLYDVEVAPDTRIFSSGHGRPVHRCADPLCDPKEFWRIVGHVTHSCRRDLPMSIRASSSTPHELPMPIRASNSTPPGPPMPIRAFNSTPHVNMSRDPPANRSRDPPISHESERLAAENRKP